MKKIFVVTALCVSLMLVGCATVKGWFASPDTQLIVQLAVTDATFRTIQAKPQWQAPIQSITTAAIGVIDNGTTTDLNGLVAFVNSKIPATLTPEEKALAGILIQNVQVSIQSYFVKNNVDPKGQLVEVRKVLGWIHDAAVIK